MYAWHEYKTPNKDQIALFVALEGDLAMSADHIISEARRRYAPGATHASQQRYTTSKTLLRRNTRCTLDTIGNEFDCFSQAYTHNLF
jgi:hypothetical protein